MFWGSKPTSLKPVAKEAHLKIGSNKVRVKIVQSSEEREAGLSGRKNLGADEGLLFVFNLPGYYAFWMKEMNFPIDIIWIGDRGQIVDLSEDLSPNSYPQTYKPKLPARYVLEVNAGWIEKNQVKIDQPVSFLP